MGNIYAYVFLTVPTYRQTDSDIYKSLYMGNIYAYVFLTVPRYRPTDSDIYKSLYMGNIYAYVFLTVPNYNQTRSKRYHALNGTRKNACCASISPSTGVAMTTALLNKRTKMSTKAYIWAIYMLMYF